MQIKEIYNKLLAKPFYNKIYKNKLNNFNEIIFSNIFTKKTFYQQNYLTF